MLYSSALNAAGFERISYVASGRKISEKEFNIISQALEELNNERDDFHVCVSLGLLTKEQIHTLKKLNVERVHNNLESSRDYFKEICTTHSYDEKLETIDDIRSENIMVCSGGIFGMGETFEDRIDLALILRDLGVKSIPINVLNPIFNQKFYVGIINNIAIIVVVYMILIIQLLFIHQVIY